MDWWDELVHSFAKDIGLKVNVTTRKAFELAYFKDTVDHPFLYRTWLGKIFKTDFGIKYLIKF